MKVRCLAEIFRWLNQMSLTPENNVRSLTKTFSINSQIKIFGQTTPLSLISMHPSNIRAMLDKCLREMDKVDDASTSIYKQISVNSLTTTGQMQGQAGAELGQAQP